MRQRIVGAIGISCEPRLLIADEPTTSLDLTIQAQYLNLLRDLQKEHGLALIFITHNLGIVAKMCDQLAVMYAGRIVESGPVSRIFNAPAHPYTRALLNSIPRMSDIDQRLTAIEGQPPDLSALPPGCSFAPRCPQRVRPLPRAGAAGVRAGRRAGSRGAGSRRRRADAGSGRPDPRSRASPGVGGVVMRRPRSGSGAAPSTSRRKKRHVRRRRAAAWCGPWTASRSRSSAARRSGSSANRAAARPPRPSSSWAWKSRPAASMRFEGQRSAGRSTPPGGASYRNSVQAVFQDPFASLNPRMRVGAIIAEPLITHESPPAGRSRKRVLELLDLVGLPARAGRSVSARILGRAAAAHRHRPGARSQPEADRARRAGLGAGRVDPRADPEPAARSAGAARRVLSVHRARPGRGGAYEPHDRGHVPRQDRRDRRGLPLARAPKHPYTAALFSAALPSHPDERREEIILPGEVPSPLNPPSGCRFHPRCPQAMPRCSTGRAGAARSGRPHRLLPPLR